MPRRRPDTLAWRYWRTVAGAVAAAVVVAIGAFTGHVRFAHANDVVDCAQVKCVALTFDDGPTPYTDRLLGILTANNAKATFFEIGNKVAANPAGAKRVVDAGMEIGNHTWEHPNMTTLPAPDVPDQLSKANDSDRRRHRGDAQAVAATGGPDRPGGQRPGRGGSGWPEYCGTSSLSTGSTTRTRRPAGLC